MRYLLCSFLLFLGVSSLSCFGYSKLSEADHLELDEKIHGFSQLSPQQLQKQQKLWMQSVKKYHKVLQSFDPKIGDAFSRVILSPYEEGFVQRVHKHFAQAPEAKKEQFFLAVAKLKEKTYELAQEASARLKKDFVGYGITKSATPLYYFPVQEASLGALLGGEGMTGLRLNAHAQVDELAVVLPPQTPLTLLQKEVYSGVTLYQVRTREFFTPSSKFAYYVDARFVQKGDKKYPERKVELPSASQLLERLKKRKGDLYVRWGSRWEGIPELTSYYPSSFPLQGALLKKKIAQGVDCSWLLYQASDGYTPRNSRQLTEFGEGLAIKGKTLEEIQRMLRPLDIIAWKGHVIIALSQDQLIESRWRKEDRWGVEISDFHSRMQEILKTRTAVNDYADPDFPDGKKFVIRRWYPQEEKSLS